jgi:hypothetical protein
MNANRGLRLSRWLIVFHLGIALGYAGLLMKAALEDLLWRADFTAFYTGGAIVRQGLGPRLYDLELQTRVQQAILGPGRMFYDGVLPFNYPPYLALVMVPFSWLPLNTAFWCWAVLQGMVLVFVLRRFLALTSGWRPMEQWLLFTALFAFFPLLLQFLLGALSLFVLWCLIEFYLALRQGKEVRAGVWLALGAVKPQAMLFPALVILGGRRWRALAGAGAAGVLLLGVTSSLLGPSIWPDYLHRLAATGSYFDHFGVYPDEMVNLKGTLTLWLGVERASMIQAITWVALIAGAMGLVILWARRKWEPEQPLFDLQFSFTLILGALLSPHQNRQDCLLLALPVVLFYNFLRRTGQPARAVAAFLLLWPTFFLLDEFALNDRLGIRLPVVLMVALLVWMGIQGLSATTCLSSLRGGNSRRSNPPASREIASPPSTACNDRVSR